MFYNYHGGASMLTINNGKWFCTKHKVYLQLCTNHTTNKTFLKCPCNKGFECGTIDNGRFNENDYEYFSPNYTSCIVQEMKEQILDNDTDYFNSDEFDF